jgi:hypothetical protein
MSNQDRLRDLIGPKTREQVSSKVDAIASIFPNHIKIYEFTYPIYRRLPGIEPTKKLKRKIKLSPDSEENLNRAIRETHKRIINLVQNNQFELFATFTFAKDRQNIAKCYSKMMNWLKNYQKRHPDDKLSYIIVPEFHADKESIHFHAVIKGFKGKLLPSINPKTGKKLIQNRREVFTIPSYRLGFTNVKKIDDSPKSASNVARYISKYITKDMVCLPNKRRYWRSKDLLKPRQIDISKEVYQHARPEWFHDGQWGKTLIFPRSILNKLDPGMDKAEN